MKVADLIGSRKEVFSIPETKSVLGRSEIPARETGAVGWCCGFDRKLIGVVSQSDISDKVAAENKCPAWSNVTEIMSRDLVTVTPEVSFDDCLRLMEQNGVYHLLILGEGPKYLGMLSVSDLLKVMASSEKARADMLESYVFPNR